VGKIINRQPPPLQIWTFDSLGPVGTAEGRPDSEKAAGETPVPTSEKDTSSDIG